MVKAIMANLAFFTLGENLKTRRKGGETGASCMPAAADTHVWTPWLPASFANAAAQLPPQA
eukprot:scaffold230565_cov21-Tisochrysis_lutea.AAC.1